MTHVLLRVSAVALSALVFAALAPGAAACVTCENQQCKAVVGSGALDCSSGWFLGSYCHLSGDCKRTGGANTGIYIAPTGRDNAAAIRIDPGSAGWSARGIYGTRTRILRPVVAAVGTGAAICRS